MDEIEKGDKNGISNKRNDKRRKEMDELIESYIKIRYSKRCDKWQKNNAEIGFEKQIWDAACVLRGNIDASEYKSVVLGSSYTRDWYSD